MDHWTTAYLVVLLGAFAATSSNGQMLMEESAGHHFDMDTLFDVEEMGCYYCINVSSNEICNRYAIETSCPTDQPVCYTQHIMDAQRQTLSVSKQCASERMCYSQIGCRHDKSANQTVCVNCCDLTYCNEEVAFNETTAVFQRSSDHSAAFSSAQRLKRWTAWSLALAGLLSYLTR